MAQARALLGAYDESVAGVVAALEVRRLQERQAADWAQWCGGRGDVLAELNSWGKFWVLLSCGTAQHLSAVFFYPLTFCQTPGFNSGNIS